MSAHRSACSCGYDLVITYASRSIIDLFDLAIIIYAKFHLITFCLLRSGAKSDQILAEPKREAHAEIIGMPPGDASEPLKFVLLMVGRNDDAIFRQNFLAGRRTSESSKNDTGVGSSDFPLSRSSAGVSEGLFGPVVCSLSVLLALVLGQ